MKLSEADTKAKLIDPVLHEKGWTEDLIRREETERGIDIIDGKPRRRERDRTDYLLRVRVNISTQPVAIALIEAKKRTEPPHKGLEQAKKYAYKYETWFKRLLPAVANTLLALAKQFERGGTEELENPYVFNAPDVVKSGGLGALKMLGEPKDIINETKKRLFAV